MVQRPGPAPGQTPLTSHYAETTVRFPAKHAGMLKRGRQATAVIRQELGFLGAGAGG
jgi:hypothetical protein